MKLKPKNRVGFRLALLTCSSLIATGLMFQINAFLYAAFVVAVDASAFLLGRWNS
jgi:hypothetical protein